MRVTSIQSKGLFNFLLTLISSFFLCILFTVIISTLCKPYYQFKKKKKSTKMGHLKLSSLLLVVLLILNILLVSADTSRTQVNFATVRAATGGNQAVALHPRTRINHGSNRGPRKHLVTLTVEQDVYTVPESSA